MLTSNLTTIIGRMDRLITGLPEAAKRTIKPDYWKPRLEVAATKTIRALWVRETIVARREVFERLTPLIVQSLMAQLSEDGMVATFTLFGVGDSPSGSVRLPDVDAAVDANAKGRTIHGTQSKNYRMSPADFASQSENLEAVKEGILEWVESEKDIRSAPGEPDAGRSKEEIAERIEYILGLGARVNEPSAAMMAAREKLMPVIQEFLNRTFDPNEKRTAGGGVEPEVIEAWLDGVLNAWIALVSAVLPDRFDTEIKREFHRINTELI